MSSGAGVMFPNASLTSGPSSFTSLRPSPNALASRHDLGMRSIFAGEPKPPFERHTAVDEHSEREAFIATCPQDLSSAAAQAA